MGQFGAPLGFEGGFFCASAFLDVAFHEGYRYGAIGVSTWKTLFSGAFMTKIFCVIAGGSLGALCRYGTSVFAVRLFGNAFPWGTLIVNLVGCFLIGLSFALAERASFVMNPTARLFFVTGFLGALTTFSSFAYETALSMKAGTTLIVIANLLANNIGGIVLVFAGMWVGRLAFGS